MVLKQLHLYLMASWKGHPLKTTHIREEDTIVIQLFVSPSTETLELSSKKESFLSRDTNSQRQIRMICVKPRERDCTVVNASGDGDLDILKMAVGEDRIYLSYSFTMHRERVRTSISDQTSLKLVTVLKCITSIYLSFSLSSSFPFVRHEMLPATSSPPHLVVVSTLLCLLSYFSILPPLLPSSHLS